VTTQIGRLVHLTFDNVFFPTLGNMVAGRCNILIGVHSSCMVHVKTLQLKPPSPTSPCPVGAFLWEPFNPPEYLVSLARDDNDFCCQDIKFHTTNPSLDITLESGVKIKYFLHGHGADKSTLCGYLVILSNSLCPPFNAETNQNMFQHLFGLKFHYKSHTHICGILPFEFAHCFGFNNNLPYCLSHPACKFSLDVAIPSMTSAWIFDQVYTHLIFLCNSNCGIFSPNKWATPAASIQSFLNGAIGT
jgi:hypothetical protein